MCYQPTPPSTYHHFDDVFVIEQLVNIHFSLCQVCFFGAQCASNFLHGILIARTVLCQIDKGETTKRALALIHDMPSAVPYPSPSSLIMRYALPLILRFELGIQQPIKDENTSRIAFRMDMVESSFEWIEGKKEMKLFE